MKIEKDTKEVNKENHRWWHGFALVNPPCVNYRSITKKTSLSNKEWSEEETWYCTKPGCGWEKKVVTHYTLEA